jgi:hypothetical protein
MVVSFLHSAQNAGLIIVFSNAISSGGRCGSGCGSSTVTPAVVFFPTGYAHCDQNQGPFLTFLRTYVISSPIVALYFTQLIGDARQPPTIRTSAGFSGIAAIDADPYLASGKPSFTSLFFLSDSLVGNMYVNQDNFFRSVRNFVIDLTPQPASNSATGLHWQVSQATSLINVVVNMSTASGNNHQGIFMENGSGGFMGGKLLRCV